MKPTSTATDCVLEASSRGVASPVVFREARFEDYEDVAAVQSRNRLSFKSREEWKRLWIENPAYKQVSQWHLGWVAQNQDGKTVGYVGHVPLSYEFRGQRIIAACAYGLVIDRDYRGHGVHLLRRHLSDKCTDVVLTSTANVNSGELCDALCSRVPTGNWGETAFWITNYRGFAASGLRSTFWPNWLARPGSVALALRDAMSKDRGWTRIQSTCALELVSGFDERFDAFWNALKQAFPERFLATRSTESLQWHFKDALARGTLWILTAGDSPMRAYAVFCRDDNSAIGLTRVRLIDFQTLDPNAIGLESMIAWAFRRCQEQGIHMLEAFGLRPEKERVINGLSPYRRKLDFWCYFYRVRDKGLAQQLRDPTVWDPSLFDADSAL
ncbi:MAG: hypothetical protein WCC25_08405 [Candidatus Korobacteraceae bacterium]